MDNYLIGIVILVIAIFGSRLIQDRETKKLSPEKKLELFEAFGNNKWPIYLFLVAVIIGFYFLTSSEILPFLYSYIIFMSVMALFMFYSMYSNYSKLKKHDFPASYIKAYLIGATIRLTGIGAFVGISFMNL